MSPSESVDRLQFENRVMAEMAGLVMSGQEYADEIEAVLDLVEQIVSSPFLGLSIQEAGRVPSGWVPGLGQVGLYTRVRDDADLIWVENVERAVSETEKQRLSHGTSTAQRSAMYRIPAPAAWIAAFPAYSRSGRGCALILGSPTPLSLDPDEEQLMLRLSRQALLVLDHALLLGQLENLEVADGLTGVTNHRRLLELLEYEMQRHRYLGKRLALVLLDIEGLDGINQSYGHQYGNHILTKLAGLVQETVRPIDVVARCGMDEFAVVLPETDEETARERAEQLRERVLGAQYAGGSVGLTVGVTHLKPDETLSAEGFLQRGEQALHEAKRQERDWNALWVAGKRRTAR